MKILAIDDNKDNLTTLQAIMQEVLPACTLLTALNGPRGLELALAEDPDVILLDIIMPGMDGYEVCRRLKADGRLRQIPVIFLTALRTDRDSRIQALDSGAEGFLSKPLDGFELVAEMRAMAKVKAAALLQRDEAKRLAGMVAERTQALQQSERSLLNTLEDMQAENEARKQAEAEAQHEQAISNTIIDSIPGTFYLLDEHGHYARWNSYQRDIILGKPDDQMAGMNAIDTIHPEDRAFIQARIANVLRDGKEEAVEGRVLLRGGPAFIWMLMTGRRMTIAGRPFLVGVGTDITGHKRGESYREMGIEVQQILNESGDLQTCIQRVITVVKTRTGFDAVGLRLQDGDDFPYYAQDGFSKEFLLTENTLIEHTADGGVCRDKDGHVCLECTCGLVISGKTDPANPLCTRGGSFWTNDSFPLLDLPADQDPRHHPRNTCIHQGCASVALIPIRRKDRIVGLIHLNDRRKGCFTLETVGLLEGIAAHIGSALMRRQAEEERTRSRDLLANLARQVPGVVYQYRLYPDGRSAFPYSSPGMNDIYEVTPEEVREDATPVFGRLHPEDRDRVSAAILESARTLVTFYCEFRVVLPRQGLRWRWSQAQPERMPDGGTLWHGIISDITERRRAEDERLRLSTAMEQASETVVITDAMGRIQYVNPGFTAVTGYTREEALGQNPRLLKSGKQDAAFYRQLWETLAAGQTWHGRFRNKRKDGTLFTEEATISPVRDAAGEIVNYVAVKRDITRELDLESQFLQAQKMEAVGRLAGGVAHDFNNMLQTILGNAELLLNDAEPDDPRVADLNEIMAAARRSADLTRQLLAFARKQTIAPKVLDLNDTIADMLKMLRRLIGEDIALTWEPAADLGPVKMDPSQLDQILANLTVNARDAIAGVGRVHIGTGNAEFDERYCKTHPDAAPGAYVMLTVSDTGCGMDPETQAHIFEPFFTTKEEGKGTGLGLATVYGIVKQNNGFIGLESEPGKGTTFKIYLPRHAATGEEIGKQARTAPTPTGTETVLLVEDEPSLLRLAHRLLDGLGYTVLAAEGPSQALRLAGEYTGDIHLLLTDVIMPGLSGSDLRNRLSATRPAMKCLFISGYTADVVARRGILREGTHFIQKPFTKTALAVKLRDVLEAKAAGGSR